MFSCFGGKKKNQEDELDYDPSDIKLENLRKGAFFDYDLKTWQVKAEYEYDWGDEFFTQEFQITTADETCYLSVEDDDELEISITKKINLRSLEGNVADYIVRNDIAPPEVVHNGVKYFKESEDAGYWRNKKNTSWEEFISWTYYDDTEKKTLTIERWDEQEFEASAGIVVQEHEFSNFILP